MRRPPVFKRGAKSFTLIELQLAIVISIITLLAAVSLYIFNWRSFTIGNTMLDVYANSRSAMGWIARDTRSAAQVVTSYGSYTTTNSCIVMQVPSVNASGDIIPSRYDYIIYRLQGSDLYRIVSKDALSARSNENRAVAHYCSSLTFSSVDPSSGQSVALASVPNLSTVNVIGVYLPLNKAATSLSGVSETAQSMSPTTIIRLRNK